MTLYRRCQCHGILSGEEERKDLMPEGYGDQKDQNESEESKYLTQCNGGEKIECLSKEEQRWLGGWNDLRDQEVEEGKRCRGEPRGAS